MIDKDLEILKHCFALTGSIATGKSTIAKLFKDLGAKIIDTDMISRDVVKPGGPALNGIIKHFGKDFLYNDGSLQRKKLRNEIINNPERRKLLNRLTHPFIMNITINKARKYINKCNNPVIIDVPLLFESNWNEMFETIILAYVPKNIQITRLMKRDNLDKPAAIAVISIQMGIEDKKKRSNIIIYNSGRIEDTGKQVKSTYKKLLNNKY